MKYSTEETMAMGISATICAVVNANQPYIRLGCSRACHSAMLPKNLGTTVLTMVGGISTIKKLVNMRFCMSPIELPSCQKVKPLKMPIMTATKSLP
jgi:hypothetical protein